MSNTLKYSALIFAAGSSYGFIVPVIKYAAELNIYPASFISIQYFIAFVACLIYMWIKRIKWGSPKKFLPLAVLGLFTGATSISYYTAVTLLPSAAALTLLFQYVWISVAIESIHKRKLPTLSSVIAIIIVLIGTIFATGLFDGAVSTLDPLGVVFGFGSAVFYALFLYFSGIIGVGQPTALRATMLAFGGLVLTSIVNPSVYVVAFPKLENWPFSLALAILGILFPTTVINYASPKLSAGMVAIMASSELPVGILAAWAFVNDVPTPTILFGSILVLIGIICKQIPSVYRQFKQKE